MNKKDLKKFEQKLLAEKERILKQLGFTGEVLLHPQKELGGDLSSYSTHPGDQGSDTYQREIASALTTQESQTLLAIDAALKKISDGTFGKCEKCTSDIPKGRLEVVPYARLCIKCKKEEDAKT
jgi:RNA polymerase-binding transcription factor DksA